MNEHPETEDKNSDAPIEDAPPEETPDMAPFPEPDTAASPEAADLDEAMEETAVVQQEAEEDAPPSPEIGPNDDEKASVSDETDPLQTAALPTREETRPIVAIGRSSQAKRDEPVMWAAKRCHMGAVRDRNEDSCLVFTNETGGHFQLMPFGLYIVADGMGGHQNGHVASKIASRTAARYIIEHTYLPLLNVDDNGPANAPPIQEVLNTAVERAHHAVYDAMHETDSGTTLTIALVLGRRLYVAHVGDTRLYLLADGNLEKVTTDHSLVQRLQDVGQLTAEQATVYEYRHVLLRAVGQGDELSIDTYTRRLPAKGKLLLCTDGLSGMVPEFEINMILQQDRSVEAIVEELFKTAMEAGGYDNITAIVVDFNL